MLELEQPMTTSPIIHHYPQSPASEKVRAFLGLKGIEWKSVIIPRIPPKPKLTALTGGFRLTPVMQIGADIYCDTTCIISELESRYPDPEMIPPGMPSAEWHMGGADDVELFKTAIAIVFSDGLDHMPRGFAQDRIGLYFDGADKNSYFTDNLSNNLDIIRAYFDKIDTAVASNQYVRGDAPSVSDAVGYYIAWFLRGRYSGGPDLIATFPLLESWEARIRNIGHGKEVHYSDDAALEDGKSNSPVVGLGVTASDTFGLELGQNISVRPADDENVSIGSLITLTDERVSIKRTDNVLGDLAIHFPRSGYVIEKA